MQPRDKSTLNFFLGLLVVALLYSAYNLYILDPEVYEFMSRGTRHLYKFGGLILTWLTGWLVYRKVRPAWLIQVWDLLYACGLGLLLLLAAYDSFIRELPLALRQPVSTFHEFLISPIAYVVIGILYRALQTGPAARP